LNGGVVVSTCRYVGMSRQAYYKGHCERKRKYLDSECIISDVLDIRKIHPMLGCRKLKFLLEAQGCKVGRDSLFELLRERELLIKPKRRYARTTDSGHSMRTYPNIIREMTITRPNEVWASDITYVRAGEGFVYMSLITDLYSRKIVGYTVNDNLEASGCIESLKMALRQLPSGTNVIHHSDRGSQYCSHQYVDLIKKNGLQISMTQDNHCYENAVAERVNGILKREYMLGTKFSGREAAVKACRDAIRIYNDWRPHLSLDLMTPSAVQAGYCNKQEDNEYNDFSFLSKDCLISTGASQGTLRSPALTAPARYEKEWITGKDKYVDYHKIKVSTFN
jgi:putative transposase